MQHIFEIFIVVIDTFIKEYKNNVTFIYKRIQLINNLPFVRDQIDGDGHLLTFLNIPFIGSVFTIFIPSKKSYLIR